MAAAAATGISSLIGAGTGIYSAIQAAREAEWRRNFDINNLNNSRAQQEAGLEAWRANYNPARDTSLQLRDLFMSAFTGEEGSQAQLQQLLKQYPGMIDQLLGSGSDPFGRGSNDGMRAIQEQNLNNRGMFQTGADLAGQVFAGGGWTPGRSGSQDRFMDMLNGQGAEMGTLGDVGTSLLGRRGQTAVTQGFQDRGMEALNRGGMNDQIQRAWAGAGALLDPEGRTGALDALQRGGLGMFGNQGMNSQNSALFNRGLSGLSGGALGTAGLTEAGGMAELAGLQDIQAGGRTDLSEALAGRGMDLANREALLPMEQVVQFAREDAARNTEGAFKRAQRQALARGGGSGAVVAAGGAEGDAMSEWADTASRSVSDAARQAMLGQQALQLQQMNTGAGMAGNAGGLENSRYGAASNLVQGMEGNATQRYQADAGIAGGALSNALGFAGLGSQTALSAQDQESQRFLRALGLMPELSNAAANQMNAYGNLALGAGWLENSRMGTGMSALNSYNQNRLGAGGLMNSSITDQGNYALNAGNLQNAFGNSFQNSGNNYYDQMLRSGAFGAGLNQAQMGAYQTNLSNVSGYNSNNAAGAQQNLQNLLNLGGQGLSWAQAGLTNQPTPPPGGYGGGGAQMWQQIGQGIANTNWGGLFGGGSGGGGNMSGLPAVNPGGGGFISQPLGQTWAPPAWKP